MYLTKTYPGELEGDQLEALSLETLDDLADQSTLDSVGLDHDEGALLVSGHFLCGLSVVKQRNSNWKWWKSSFCRNAMPAILQFANFSLTLTMR